MARCTPSIVGSPPNRPPCAGSPRSSRAALNLWRYLARWPTRCADACLRTPPDCGASNRIGEITLVAAAADPEALARWPVGTRTPVDGDTLATLVQRTGRPARIDSYDNVAGPIAARVRAVGVRAAVGVPIIVDGRVWGLAAVGSLQPGPMPADTEVHISRFAELIATALVAGYRDEQNRQLLAEASRRSNLIDALLEGRAFDDWSLRDLAGHLRLPINGPFVVIAAHVPTRVMSRSPRSNRSCAALTSFRRGGGCLICRSGSCTSSPTTNSTGLLP